MRKLFVVWGEQPIFFLNRLGRGGTPQSKRNTTETRIVQSKLWALLCNQSMCPAGGTVQTLAYSVHQSGSLFPECAPRPLHKSQWPHACLVGLLHPWTNPCLHPPLVAAVTACQRCWVACLQREGRMFVEMYMITRETSRVLRACPTRGSIIWYICRSC